MQFILPELWHFCQKKQSSLSLDVKTLFVKENPGNFRKSGSEKTLQKLKPLLTHKFTITKFKIKHIRIEGGLCYFSLCYPCLPNVTYPLFYYGSNYYFLHWTISILCPLQTNGVLSRPQKLLLQQQKLPSFPKNPKKWKRPKLERLMIFFRETKDKKNCGTT